MLHLLKKNPKKMLKMKTIENWEIIVIIQGNTEHQCNLKFNVPNEIPVVFNNSPNYDYHVIIEELADQFEGQFEYLEENKEK